MNRDSMLDSLAMNEDNVTPERAALFGFSVDEYHQRRQELINCPPDSEAPEWAKWKAQDSDGTWTWFEDSAYADEDSNEWLESDNCDGSGGIGTATNGKIPAGHRWQDTLTRINRDDNNSTPDEEEEFERIQARMDADRPHSADARILDAQLADAMGKFANAIGGACRAGETEGLKYDQEKPRLDLLINDMPLALEEIAAVLTYGANKYSPGNWLHVDNAEDRYLAAQMRHELSYAKGNEVDGETHIHELAHSACCALFRLELALRNR